MYKVYECTQTPIIEVDLLEFYQSIG